MILNQSNNQIPDDPREKYFDAYRVLVREADLAFERVKEQYGDLVRCKQGCNDCCFAVFEMHPVEAVLIARSFATLLKRKERREIIRRAEKARDRLRAMEEKFARESGTPESQERMLAISRERLECPLHFKGGCVLYGHRPITCRVYGVPTAIRGKGATCGRSGFEPGARYPTVNLDIVDRRLQEISRAMLAEVAGIDIEDRRLLVSMGEALTEELDERYFRKRGV